MSNYNIPEKDGSFITHKKRPAAEKCSTEYWESYKSRLITEKGIDGIKDLSVAGIKVADEHFVEKIVAVLLGSGKRG